MGVFSRKLIICTLVWFLASLFSLSHIFCENTSYTPTYKEASAASTGVESDELFIFKTNISQDNPDIKFVLNGERENEDCDDLVGGNNDNVYVKFTTGDSKPWSKRATYVYFHVPTVDETYAYGLLVPKRLKRVVTFVSLQFHLTTGEMHKGSDGNYYPTLINLNYTYPSGNNSNYFSINCTNNTVTAIGKVDIDDLYDMYGAYFLNTVSCVNYGQSGYLTDLESRWNSVKNSKFFVNNNFLPDNFLSIFSTYTPSGDTSLDRAIIRYDYILFFKCYNFNNFLSRTSNITPRNSVNSSIFFRNENIDCVNLSFVISISIICLSSITLFIVLLIRKRKRNV